MTQSIAGRRIRTPNARLVPFVCSALFAACGGESDVPEAIDLARTEQAEIRTPIVGGGSIGRVSEGQLPNLTPERTWQAPPRSRPRENVTPRFSFATLGDSYAAGEGAPAIKGNYEWFGTDEKVAEYWGDGLPQGLNARQEDEFVRASIRPGDNEVGVRFRFEREARACHRSDEAGYAHARAQLAEDWGIQVVAQSFACSGAVVDNVLDKTDVGAAGCGIGEDVQNAEDAVKCRRQTDAVGPSSAIRPQLEQLAASERALGKFDAVYMSIGGNDMGFGKIITDCLVGSALETPVGVLGPVAASGLGPLMASAPPLTAAAIGGLTAAGPLVELFTNFCADEGSGARQVIEDGKHVLPGSYDRLAEALRARGYHGAQIAISNYPDPLVNGNGEGCNAGDFLRAGDPWFATVAGDWSGNIGWIRNTVIKDINRLVSAAAARNGFRVVDVHAPEAYRAHGMCVPRQAQYFNDLFSAQVTQGSDNYIPMFPPLISTGAVHPNVEGHRQVYGPAIAEALEPLVREKLTPTPPTNFRLGKVERLSFNGRPTSLSNIEVHWDDTSDRETSYSVVVTVDGRRSAAQSIAANSVSYGVSTSFDTASASIEVRACYEGRERLCSAPVTYAVATQPPARAPTLSAHSDVLSAPIGVRVTDPNTSTQFYRFVTRNGSITAASDSERGYLPVSRGLEVQVQACNLLGCSPPSPVLDFRGHQNPTETCAVGFLFVRGRCVPDTDLFDPFRP